MKDKQVYNQNLRSSKTILFQGLCPESLLWGENVEMRLNRDDFWESEATGLQIATFSPHATILPWRGSGKFRQERELASSNSFKLLFAQATKELGREFLPNTMEEIPTWFDFEWYISTIYTSKKSYDQDQFDPKDPKLKTQENYLKTLPKSDLLNLKKLFKKYEADQTHESFQFFVSALYELNIIFNFNWMKWYKGWENLNDLNYDYSISTLLEISMYLTCIIRNERFMEGTIDKYLVNSSIKNIVLQIDNK